MINQETRRVIIVGGGLTGLSAAITLYRAGIPSIILEKESFLGGRMSAKKTSDFILDFGFQVALSKYSELQLLCNPYEELGGTPFDSGAIILGKLGAHRRIYNPIKHPFNSLKNISNGILSFSDVIPLLKFARSFMFSSEPVGTKTHETTHEYVDSFHFSEDFAEDFLKPFLRGVFLEKNLSADSSLAQFYLKCFTLGKALLLQNGASTLPDWIRLQLPQDSIKCNSKVTHVHSDSVTLDDGTTLSASATIVATRYFDRPHFVENQGSELATSNSHFESAVCTFYYSAPKPPFSDKLIALNPNPQDKINHLAVLTNINANYSKTGEALISVTALTSASSELILSELRTWFGDQVSAWNLITEIIINDPLPQSPQLSSGWFLQNGVYFAGDDLSYGSQNAALGSGRRVANTIISSLLSRKKSSPSSS